MECTNSEAVLNGQVNSSRAKYSDEHIAVLESLIGEVPANESWTFSVDCVNDDQSETFDEKTELLRRVYSIILQHIGDQVSQDALASMLNIAPRTLRRRLEVKNTNYRKMQSDVRKLISKKMLMNSSQPITEIGFYVGFCDTSAFTKAFKEWFGVCPSEYRRSLMVSNLL